jgi:mannosyltransferase OCH1-like enzyme
MYWDEKTMQNIIDNDFPQIKQKYDNCKMIQKIDIAKYCILYKYGGLYVDLDAECLKPFDDFLNNNDLILLRMDKANIFKKIFLFKNRDYIINNSTLASKKNHKFWLLLIDKINNTDFEKKWYHTNFTYIFFTTGPIIIYDAYIEYINNINKDITLITDSRINSIYYCDYITLNKNSDEYKEKLKNSYSVHHYGSSVKNNSWLKKHEIACGYYFCKFKKYKSFIIFIIFLVILIILIKKNYIILS